jgi:hypothetical protein
MQANDLTQSPQTINTYTVSGSIARLKEVLIIPTGPKSVFSGYPFAKKLEVGRGRNKTTLYQVRDVENNPILITDQEGFDNLFNFGFNTLT